MAAQGATSSTVPSNVAVNSFLSLALSTNLSAGIQFGSVDPNDNNATIGSGNANYNATFWMYIGTDSNANGDFCIRDNETLSTGNPKIGNSNYTYSNATLGSNGATNPAPYGTNNITATAQNSLGIRFATNMAPGQPAFLRFFLNVSGGQPAGIYSNEMSFLAAQTSGSVSCGT